jgi:hypothetical protein
MRVDWWVVVLVTAVVLFGLYLRGLAGRLDRLHVRVEAAAEALDAQLVRRSAAVLETATCGLLDPASSMLLAEAAHAAQVAERPQREEVESALTHALRATLDGPEVSEVMASGGPGQEVLADLAEACHRVVLARRFHNDAAAATFRLRRQRVVRYLRLAGSAPMPRTFEMDDLPPEPLRIPG